MKEKMKFLFQDKTVLPVFIVCGVIHIIILFRYKEFFSLPWYWITIAVTLVNIGVTLCIVHAVKKWKGRKK